MHETTTKVVRQRQLPSFLLANENNTPLSLGEKAKTQWPWWQVNQHRDSLVLETTCCQEPGQGTSEHRRAWPCWCARWAAQTSTSPEALPSGIDSRGKEPGGEERKHGWQRDRCSKVPTASLTRKEGWRRGQTQQKPLQAYHPLSAMCKTPATSCPCFPAMFQLGGRVRTKTEWTLQSDRCDCCPPGRSGGGAQLLGGSSSPALTWPTDTACRDRGWAPEKARITPLLITFLQISKKEVQFQTF